MPQAERFAEYEIGSLEKVLETDLKSFGKGISVLEQVWLHEFGFRVLAVYHRGDPPFLLHPPPPPFHSQPAYVGM